jgi:hypothetical protein
MLLLNEEAPDGDYEARLLDSWKVVIDHGSIMRMMLAIGSIFIARKVVHCKVCRRCPCHGGLNPQGYNVHVKTKKEKRRI